MSTLQLQDNSCLVISQPITRISGDDKDVLLNEEYPIAPYHRDRCGISPEVWLIGSKHWVIIRPGGNVNFLDNSSDFIIGDDDAVKLIWMPDDQKWHVVFKKAWCQ